MTLELIPLSSDGLGAVLRANRRGALEWAELIKESSQFSLYQAPELDIVTYYPTAESLSAVDAASAKLFVDAAALPPAEQIHLATYSAKAAAFVDRGFDLVADVGAARIMRSTVMKPESADRIGEIHAKLESLVR
jgi:hypothetical protein